MIIKSYIDKISTSVQQTNKRSMVEQVAIFKKLVNSNCNNNRKSNKLSPRERIKQLIDGDFFELSVLAGYKLYDKEIVAGGIITGIADINGITCMILCNDYNVVGGTYFPITIKKHLRAQEIAAENSLPCVYIVDSGGAYLPLQSEVFADKEHFGRIFYNQARMSAQGIAQIAVVMGSCTAGGAYLPAMADESVMVKNQATIFLAGPPLLKAATGEVVTAEDLGGADLHCYESGVADYYAEDDTDALKITRNIIANLNVSDKHTSPTKFTEPKYDIADIYRIINADLRHQYDVLEIIARIADNSEMLQFKENFATTLVCGFIKIHGFSAGVIANNGILFSEAALKGCHFVQLCSKRKLPIIFLQNITGFMVGKQAESKGIAKHGAMLVNAVATSAVAKITIIIGSSYGAGNYAMCGRAYNPRFLWSWPNSKTAVMGGTQAADVLAAIKTKKMSYTQRWSELEQQKFKAAINTKFSYESSAFYTSANLMDDGIIDPKDSRKFLAFALKIIANGPNITTSNHGVFRT